jgi:hypothetical protein
MREGVTADSGGAREQIIGVHSGAKIAKKPFLGVAHMVKNCSYTKKTKITPGPVHPLGELGSAPDCGRVPPISSWWLVLTLKGGDVARRRFL